MSFCAKMATVLHISLYLHLLQHDFAAPSIKKWSISSHSLDLACFDVCPVPNLGLKKLCICLLLLSEPYYYHVNKPWWAFWKTKVHMEQNSVVPDENIQNQRWSTECSPNPQLSMNACMSPPETRRNTQPTIDLWAKIWACCLKSLSSGVACFAIIPNWYKNYRKIKLDKMFLVRGGSQSNGWVKSVASLRVGKNEVLIFFLFFQRKHQLKQAERYCFKFTQPQAA